MGGLTPVIVFCDWLPLRAQVVCTLSVVAVVIRGPGFVMSFRYVRKTCTPVFVLCVLFPLWSQDMGLPFVIRYRCDQKTRVGVL